MNLPENLNIPEKLNLPVNIPEQADRVKKIFIRGLNSWTETAQQTSESWQGAATQVTDKVVDRVVSKFTTTTEQAKDSLGNTFQIAIDSSLGNWLEQHPIFFKLVQILGWGANHPIISVIAIIFAIALIFSLIKAVVRLIESASLSIFRLPLKLIQTALKLSFSYFNKFIKIIFIKIKRHNVSDSFVPKQLSIPNNINNSSNSIHSNQVELIGTKVFYSPAEKRLKEISSRLSEIQKEQQELLQEASSILNPGLNSNSDLNSDLNSGLNSEKIRKI